MDRPPVLATLLPVHTEGQIREPCTSSQYSQSTSNVPGPRSWGDGDK